jgi:hypothetical protein
MLKIGMYAPFSDLERAKKSPLGERAEVQN